MKNGLSTGPASPIVPEIADTTNATGRNTHKRMGKERVRSRKRYWKMVLSRKRAATILSHCGGTWAKMYPPTVAPTIAPGTYHATIFQFTSRQKSQTRTGEERSVPTEMAGATAFGSTSHVMTGTINSA